MAQTLNFGNDQSQFLLASLGHHSKAQGLGSRPDMRIAIPSTTNQGTSSSGKGHSVRMPIITLPHPHPMHHMTIVGSLGGNTSFHLDASCESKLDQSIREQDKSTHKSWRRLGVEVTWAEFVAHVQIFLTVTVLPPAEPAAWAAAWGSLHPAWECEKPF